MRIIDLTGQKFARLEVIRRAPNKGKYVCWLCRCDCGNEHAAPSIYLRSGESTSCGCFHNELRSAQAKMMAGLNTKHGKSTTPECYAWSQMRLRCTKTTHLQFKYYGARGIFVCQEWMDSFEVFLAHVGQRPGRGYSLDRIDNNKGYFPGNVRWATRIEQENNKRSNRIVEFRGKTMTATQAYRLAAPAFSIKTFWNRFYKRGSIDAVLS